MHLNVEMWYVWCVVGGNVFSHGGHCSSGTVFIDRSGIYKGKSWLPRLTDGIYTMILVRPVLTAHLMR